MQTYSFKQHLVLHYFCHTRRAPQFDRSHCITKCLLASVLCWNIESIPLLWTHNLKSWLGLTVSKDDFIFWINSKCQMLQLAVLINYLFVGVLHLLVLFITFSPW